MASRVRFIEQAIASWKRATQSSYVIPVRNFRLTPSSYAVMVKMPSLSPTMTSGTIVRWAKKEGEAVAPGDMLCEIQTDKAVVAFEVDEEGTLAKILMPENSTDVQVGSVIAIMAESGEDWKSVKVPEGMGKAAPAQAKPAAAAAATPTPQKKAEAEAKPAHPGGPVLLGPAVRLLLELYQLKANDVSATGPKGQLLKSDVLKFIDSRKLKPKPRTAEPPAPPAKAAPSAAPAPQPGAIFTDVSLSNMRRTIAKRLTQSKTSIPHAYGKISVDVGAVLALRKQLKADGIAVTINDFIIKAVASALKQVPEVNVQFDGSDNVRYMQTIDVSVAVATESGLITPIVHNADQLGVVAISAKVKELADKAKANKLQLQEFQGGTFTVSNLGMFGIENFTAIINPPQAAILAIGGSQSTLDSELRPIEKMTVTLCFDNRAIDENSAARWLQAFKQAIEDPSFILLGADSSLSEEALSSFL